MANSTAILAVQAQLFATINVTAVTNLFAGNPVVRVMDEVPEGTDYPYVEIGHIEETLDNVFTKHGREVRVQLDIYSSAPGNKEVELIVEQLNILLDDTLLPNPTNWRTVLNEYELGTLDKDFDIAGVRKFVAQYRFLVEEP